MKVETLMNILQNYSPRIEVYLGAMHEGKVVNKRIDYAEFSNMDMTLTLWSEED